MRHHIESLEWVPSDRLNDEVGEWSRRRVSRKLSLKSISTKLTTSTTTTALSVKDENKLFPIISQNIDKNRYLLNRYDNNNNNNARSLSREFGDNAIKLLCVCIMLSLLIIPTVRSQISPALIARSNKKGANTTIHMSNINNNNEPLTNCSHKRAQHRQQLRHPAFRPVSGKNETVVVVMNSKLASSSKNKPENHYIDNHQHQKQHHHHQQQQQLEQEKPYLHLKQPATSFATPKQSATLGATNRRPLLAALTGTAGGRNQLKQLDTNETPLKRRKYHNNRPSNDSESSGSSSSGVRIPHGAACSGCLAIPVQAIIGGKRLEGFIIPPKRPSKGNNENNKRQQQQQQLAYLHYRQLPAAPSAESATSEYNIYHQQASYYHTPSANSYGSKSLSEQQSLEPSSDDKCPMTGPLTVCDQIGSYPVDVILRKLDNAKRVLKQSNFNLDSLFTDESQHSSDPFEDDDSTNKHNTRQSREGERGFSHNSNNTASDINNYEYGGQSNGYANEYIPANNETQAGWEDQKLDYHVVRRGNQYVVDYGHESKEVNNIAGYQQKQRSSEADEFVDLVEQRAVSISNQPLAADFSRRRKSSKGPEVNGANEAVDELDQFHTNRFDQGRAPYSEEQQQPLMFSGKVLADRLLSISKSLSNQYPENKLSDGSYQSYQVALSVADSSPQSVVTSAATSDPSFPSAANSNHSTASLDAASTSVDLALTSGGQVTRRLKRPRRQVNVSLASNGIGGNQQAAGGGETVVDPERVSEAANLGQPPPEPVCRAKSIYISPRAALNDKKQWKYVVNAPERDPQVRQIIRVDICEDPLGPCSDQVTLPFGFTSQCKQKYSKKKLLALDSQTGLLEVDTFFIPSCCVCQLIRQPIVDESTEAAGGGEETNSSSNQDSGNNGSTNEASGDSLQGDGGRAAGDSSSSSSSENLGSSGPQMDSNEGFETGTTESPSLETTTIMPALNLDEASLGPEGFGPEPISSGSSSGSNGGGVGTTSSDETDGTSSGNR